MKPTVKNAAALLGGIMLASGAATGAAPAFANAPESAAVAEAAEAQNNLQATKAVEGEFSFTQNKVTGMDVFAKAAAAVCAAVPDYAMTCTCPQISIQSNESELVATVQELMTDENIESHIMGCACSSNVAGGGAIGNAEVSGVSLASLAAMMDA